MFAYNYISQVGPKYVSVGIKNSSTATKSDLVFHLDRRDKFDGNR